MTLTFITLAIIFITVLKCGFNIFTLFIVMGQLLIYANIVGTLNTFKANAYLANKYDEQMKHP